MIVGLINPLTAKLFNWNFHSLEVREKYSDLTNWTSAILKSC